MAVYVKSGLGNYHFDTPKDPVVLTQKGCMYDPHVLALMVNQPMQVVNDDPVLHNIHVVARDNRSWNRSETAGMDAFRGDVLASGAWRGDQVQRPSLDARFRLRFQSSVFRRDYQNRKFELKNLPPGTYTIEAWQEKYGAQDQTVTIGPKESKAISFTYKAAASPAK